MLPDSTAPVPLVLPRSPCVPRGQWVAAVEEGRHTGARDAAGMAEGELQAALPEGNPPPERLQDLPRGRDIKQSKAQSSGWAAAREGGSGRGCHQWGLCQPFPSSGSIPGGAEWLCWGKDVPKLHLEPWAVFLRALCTPKAFLDPPHGPLTHPCRAETGWAGA